MADLLKRKEIRIPRIETGQKIMAKVVEITKKSVILDIGGKSEGLVIDDAFDEARDLIKTLAAGDEVWTKIIVPETSEGVTLLSLRQAAYEAFWNELTEAKNSSKEVTVLGKHANETGVSVEVDGVNGFIPISQLGKKAYSNPQELIGKRFPAKIIEIDRQKGRIVLSEKAVSEKDEVKLQEDALKALAGGEIVEGVIMKLTTFGAFVEIPASVGKKEIKIEGLVYITELSWEKRINLEEVYKVGDKIKVKVLGLRDGKLALSAKQAQKDPWEEVERKYKKDSKIEGKVARISDFGIFIEIEFGIEGLLHLTKIPPGRSFKVGEAVNCYIEEVDAKGRRISLGLVLTSKPIGYK